MKLTAASAGLSALLFVAGCSSEPRFAHADDGQRLSRGHRHPAPGARRLPRPGRRDRRGLRRRAAQGPHLAALRRGGSAPRSSTGLVHGRAQRQSSWRKCAKAFLASPLRAKMSAVARRRHRARLQESSSLDSEFERSPDPPGPPRLDAGALPRPRQRARRAPRGARTRCSTTSATRSPSSDSARSPRASGASSSSRSISSAASSTAAPSTSRWSTSLFAAKRRARRPPGLRRALAEARSSANASPSADHPSSHRGVALPRGARRERGGRGDPDCQGVNVGLARGARGCLAPGSKSPRRSPETRRPRPPGRPRPDREAPRRARRRARRVGGAGTSRSGTLLAGRRRASRVRSRSARPAEGARPFALHRRRRREESQQRVGVRRRQGRAPASSIRSPMKDALALAAMGAALPVALQLANAVATLSWPLSFERPEDLVQRARAGRERAADWRPHRLARPEAARLPRAQPAGDVHRGRRGERRERLPRREPRRARADGRRREQRLARIVRRHVSERWQRRPRRPRRTRRPRRQRRRD